MFFHILNVPSQHGIFKELSCCYARKPIASHFNFFHNSLQSADWICWKLLIVSFCLQWSFSFSSHLSLTAAILLTNFNCLTSLTETKVRRKRKMWYAWYGDVLMDSASLCSCPSDQEENRAPRSSPGPPCQIHLWDPKCPQCPIPVV